MGNCKLCDNFKEIKNSHIIPKFLYRHMNKVTDNELLQISSEIRVWQKSQRQKVKQLFCNECEQILSVNEYEFSNIFKSICDTKPENRRLFVSVPDFNEATIKENIDKRFGYGFYERFKDLISKSKFSVSNFVLKYYAISCIYREVVSNEYNLPEHVILAMKDYLLNDGSFNVDIIVRININETPFPIITTVIVLDKNDKFKHFIFYVPEIQFQVILDVDDYAQTSKSILRLPEDLFSDEIEVIKLLKSQISGSRIAKNAEEYFT